MNTGFPKLDIAAIAERYSTPLYFCNRAQILRNLHDFADLLGGANHILFPVKANPCLATLQILAEQGCGADCAAPHEINLARLAGIPTSQLSYYSPAPDLDLAESLLREGGTVIIDAPSKLAGLETRLREVPFHGKLLLRVNPSLSQGYSNAAAYQQYTDHGSLSSQFGLPSEEVIPLLKSTSLPFSGLHVHVGTQMDNVKIFQEVLSVLHDLCLTINTQTPHQIEQLNLGGGLGVAAHEGQTFPTIRELGTALKQKMQPDLTYKMEPGNALVGNAMGLLTRVVTRKRTRDREWAIVDVGTDQLMKVTMAGFDQQILCSDGQPLPRKGADGIAGPLCFAGDVLLPATDLTGVEEGDVLLLTNVGSYCRAVGNNFNGKSAPGTFLIDDEQELGLVYRDEDLFWEPSIQSFQPLGNCATWETGEQSSEEILSDQLVNQLRSEYLHQQCAADTYQFHSFTRCSPNIYEVDVEVRSSVAFVSAPLVMRIISDATIVATLDALGKTKKDVSVWGNRFTVSLDGILRSNHRQRFRIHLSAVAPSLESNKQELLAHWQLGSDRCFGSIRVLV